MKANEIRNMTPQEIENKIDAMKKDLFGLRSQAKAGRIEKPHLISLTRRDIARCETILREKTNAGKKDL